MSRVVRSPWLVTLVLVFLLGGPLWYASCMRTNASLAATPPLFPMQQPPALTPVELTDGLLRAGFEAKALTAVGVTSNGVAAFVAAFRDSLATQQAAIDAADTSLDAALVTSDALRRKIESGKGSAEDVTAYQTQMSAANSAKASRDAAFLAARTPAEALLSSEQRAQLARIRVNTTWELPTEFLLVDRAEVQWVALRDALANEKIAPRYGEEVGQQHASVLSTARSNPDVALAKTRLESNLASVEAAIHAAIVE